MFDAYFSLSFGRLKASSGYVTKGSILSRRFHILVKGELKNHLLHALDRRISKGSIALQFSKVSMHRGTKKQISLMSGECERVRDETTYDWGQIFTRGKMCRRGSEDPPKISPVTTINDLRRLARAI